MGDGYWANGLAHHLVTSDYRIVDSGISLHCHRHRHVDGAHHRHRVERVKEVRVESEVELCLQAEMSVQLSNHILRQTGH